jgi:hypothetical protein
MDAAALGAYGERFGIVIDRMPAVAGAGGP